MTLLSKAFNFPPIVRGNGRRTTDTVRDLLNPVGAYTDSAMARMFWLLCDHPHGLTCNEIANRIYVDDPDGGPLSGGRQISVMAHRFNTLAKKYHLGVRINNRIGEKRGTTGAGRMCIWIVRESA